MWGLTPISQEIETVKTNSIQVLYPLRCVVTVGGINYNISSRFKTELFVHGWQNRPNSELINLYRTKNNFGYTYTRAIKK